jgi:hypothetical protein
MLSILLSFLFFGQSFARYAPTTYSLVKDFQAGTSNFFNNFKFYTGPDPTNGFVNYLSQTDATNGWLAYNWNGVSYFGANSWDYAPNGRSSVRLESKTSFTEVLIIAQFNHVPGSDCGLWPAFWTSNLSNWPTGGEIDILEGVNNEGVNHYAAHTTSGCKQSGQVQSSWASTTNCDVNAPSQDTNAGCGGWAASTSTYGDGMNAAGGGVYVLDWRKEGIRTWYFSPKNIPADIKAGNPTATNWGTPLMDLPNVGCNIPQYFYNHQIIFDITYDPIELSDLGFAGTGRVPYTARGVVRERARIKWHGVRIPSQMRTLDLQV